MNNLVNSRRRTMLVLPILGALLVAISPSAVAADTAGQSLEFASEVGAHPLDGRTGHWETPTDEVDVREFQNIVTVDASTDGGWDWIRLELSGPDSAPLQTGVYRDVRHQGQHTATPGILVISNGLGCGEDYAEFTMTAPALRGQLHYSA